MRTEILILSADGEVRIGARIRAHLTSCRRIADLRSITEDTVAAEEVALGIVARIIHGVTEVKRAIHAVIAVLCRTRDADSDDHDANLEAGAQHAVVTIGIGATLVEDATEVAIFDADRE